MSTVQPLLLLLLPALAFRMMLPLCSCTCLLPQYLLPDWGAYGLGKRVRIIMSLGGAAHVGSRVEERMENIAMIVIIAILLNRVALSRIIMTHHAAARLCRSFGNYLM